MKVCTHCGKQKRLRGFYRNSKGCLRAECISCHKKRWRKYYLKGTQYYRDKSRRRRREMVEFIRSLKHNKRCTDCRKKFPYWVLQFDHLRDKQLQLSDVSRFSSPAHVLREVAKCELVCANCHAHRTHRRRKAAKR